jgi:hypothetical protein
MQVMEPANATVRLDCECSYRRLARFKRRDAGWWVTKEDVYPKRRSWTFERVWPGEVVSESPSGEKWYDEPRMSRLAVPGALLIECPAPRCKRTHKYRNDVLERALDSALKYGRRVLVLGVDL